jgi:nicotinate phosphoribosyltransferase
MLGKPLRERPNVLRALRELHGFEGEIDALHEGTLAFAGPARFDDGSPLLVGETAVRVYIPLLQVRTDMLRAKLIETPWLGYINHLSMVASKAARVVSVAAGKPVLEFGSRRTHPAAAVDAAYAAYIAGCAGTSNMAAYARYGIPAVGTMDHFAVQASEREGASCPDTELQFFAAFARLFPEHSTLLVDTYDTWRGIGQAVAATEGKLKGIRMDSNVTPETAAKARALLDQLGAREARIFASDGLDERRVRELSPYVDGFGVGEQIVCSPDAATGVSAVAKLTVNGYGKITMKLAKGSGKATLPGELQAYRYADHDLVALRDEAVPSGGDALLRPVWRGRSPTATQPTLEETRAYVARQLGGLPDELRAIEPATQPRPLVITRGLADTVLRLAKEAEA